MLQCDILLCFSMAACNAESFTRVGLLMPAVVSDGEGALDPTFQKFPSIGHLKHLYKHLRAITPLKGGNSDEIEYEGTVKVHESPCDSISANPSTEWQLQSRNRVLTAEADNCGFVKFVQNHAAAIQDIISKLER